VVWPEQARCSNRRKVYADWAAIGATNGIQMKQPVVTNPAETKCPECMGAGYSVVPHPQRPAVQTFQVCKECKGKGRVAAN